MIEVVNLTPDEQRLVAILRVRLDLPGTIVLGAFGVDPLVAAQVVQNLRTTIGLPSGASLASVLAPPGGLQ